MLQNTKRPVILPLSNPTSKAEAQPQDIYDWAQGRALVATGSPFDPVVWQGDEIRIGQCNNVFIFPGVGLGVLASSASEVLPQFFTAAAHAVAEQVDEADLQKGVLFPPVSRLREISKHVAIAVAQCAVREGVSRPFTLGTFQHKNDPKLMVELIENMRWKPDYIPLVAM